MQVTASIFKAYDIRGTYLRTLDESLAEGLGRAFGTLALKEGRHAVAVGRDGRLSGPLLSTALIRGLVSVGIQVIDVGLTTTPQQFATVAFKSQAVTTRKTTTVSRWFWAAAPFMATKFKL
jgi:phosphomannomutase